jgi:hypothetical protein
MALTADTRVKHARTNAIPFADVSSLFVAGSAAIGAEDAEFAQDQRVRA